ncbi:hypothetical protein GCM10008992_22520 [Halorubrum aquaticum]
MEFGEVEARELPGRTLIGVVVALVPDVEVHSGDSAESVIRCAERESTVTSREGDADERHV